MLRLFTPKKYVKDYRFVDIDDLRKNNIKLVICDIDNTLVAHDEKHPNEDVKQFVKSMQEHFSFCLISNNFNERVTTFASDLHVPCYSMAKKPLKLTYHKIMREMGFKADEIASIGDQIMTDILGGNRCHIYTILTHPLVERDLKSTKINRIFENMVFRALAKRNILKKGEFNE